MPGPFLLRIQGHPCQQQVTQKNTKGLSRGKQAATVKRCYMLVEQAVDIGGNPVDMIVGVHLAEASSQKLTVLIATAPSAIEPPKSSAFPTCWKPWVYGNGLDCNTI